MVKIVKHLHSEIAHGVGLLRDRRLDHSFANPVEGVVVCIHGDHELAGDVIVVEHCGHFFASLRLEANERIDGLFLVDDALRFVEDNAWIAFHVHDALDLDLRIAFKHLLIAAQPGVEVGLAGHSEDHQVSSPMKLLGSQLTAAHTRVVIVRSHEKEALAHRRVGINGDHRNSRGNRCIDRRPQKLRISRGHQDSRRLRLHRFVECLLLRSWIVIVRSGYFRANLHLLRGLVESGRCRLPVRDLCVYGDEVILFVAVVFGAGSQTEHGNQGNKRAGKSSQIKHENTSSRKCGRETKGPKERIVGSL